MGVLVTKLANGGLLLDASSLPGAGAQFSKLKFIPKGNIKYLLLFDDIIVGEDGEGKITLNLTGVDGAFPIQSIEGVVMTSVEQIFNSLITII